MDSTTLSLFIRAQNSAYSRLQRADEERGATTVEYIMILGIMALVVAAIFLVPDIGLKSRIEDLGNTIKGTIGNIV